jgi:hypothetical protein
MMWKEAAGMDSSQVSRRSVTRDAAVLVGT